MSKPCTPYTVSVHEACGRHDQQTLCMSRSCRYPKHRDVARVYDPPAIAAEKLVAAFIKASGYLAVHRAL